METLQECEVALVTHRIPARMQCHVELEAEHRCHAGCHVDRQDAGLTAQRSTDAGVWDAKVTTQLALTDRGRVSRGHKAIDGLVLQEAAATRPTIGWSFVERHRIIMPARTYLPVITGSPGRTDPRAEAGSQAGHSTNFVARSGTWRLDRPDGEPNGG